MNAFVEILSVGAIVAGAAFFAAGTIGLLRFPDTMTRLHALTKADNLGIGLVILGLLPRAGSITAGIKLLLVWGLVLFAGAIVSQLVARVARRKPPP